MKSKIEKILGDFALMMTESTENAINYAREALRREYVKVQKVRKEYGDNCEYNCGDIAKQNGFAVGEIGCPYCGVGHIGKLARVCLWCERDMFSKNSKSVLQVLDEFVENRPKEWREGQAYFNVAYQLWPEYVEEIRGTQTDPFHNDDRVEEFKEHLLFLLTH